MDLIDATVVKVWCKPYFLYNKWWVKVTYESWGRESNTELMFSTEEEANSVDKGYEFLC